jgi:hypothetical protein
MESLGLNARKRRGPRRLYGEGEGEGENWVAEREEMYWVLKRVDREREREGGSREDATTPTNF